MESIRRTTSHEQSGNRAPSSPSTQRSPNVQLSDINKPCLPATTDPPSHTNPPKQKVWLIFGATGHMGRSVTKAALSHGDLVCAVGQSLSDTPATLSSLCPSSSSGANANTTTTANTNSTADDSYLGLLCDVRIRPSVSAALDATLSHFGRIDIIANCSGYGVIGACEDQDEHEIRNQFETNFMGTLNMIQLSLPYFRRRQAGRYLIFSSTSGALGVPGLGPYCATKYAVEGLIESMLYEVDPFGIKVTLVEPGHLRRDDDHGSSCPGSNLPSSGGVPTTTSTTTTTRAAQNNNAPLPTTTTTTGLSVNQLPLFGHFKVAKASEPYAGKDAPAAHAQRTLHWMGNQQPTSVVKAAELVWQLGHCRYPPLRLLLGSFAVESIRDRLKSIIEEIEDWKHLSFPPLDPDPEAEGEGEGEDDGEGEGEEDDDNDDNEEEDDRDDDEDDDDDNNEDGDQIDMITAARNKGHGASRAIKAESMMDVDE
ncbi:1,2-dihydroxy-3-keto-5-methylthiopentene dioxygenase [Exophiala xenobiotica]|uniref:1,2-dihydroxy-3-keto-5-methylthiopentene dioxygenase n=1 Tax=Vermiconidia calcicola TaxID=1690605 RepID=A0AAV9Q4D3_9PEZI|nr:1,2-dihydroxy-3-keto-5-methylthiopentene dioxygenase [Exophiala xenobiotica]KAK5429173.1 1,2-dihydroxy-3-keto-5-methylthiopentene dioxygenase [Exophiala xenobiotica]KAK5535098.1 1,2-dihydroxy-3-keto-5-methylthiopentene dioxygenase [Vermiconidia calcicola]KAK5535556.1 1,2-dihydroxy-3-keto-5-methylthiopentene dioxygenase [Chaetothyriales sp. CCFEE 6169]